MNFVSTKAYAAARGIKAESVHARLSRTGSYFGDRPKKLPNGRLDWSKPTKGEIGKRSDDAV